MKLFYKLINNISKLIFNIFYRRKVYGLEHYYDKGAILAPNHVSFLDPPIVSTSWPKEVHFLATDYLFKIPIFGSIIKALNAHPINRGTRDVTSIKKICLLLEKGFKVIIFPEGGRSKDGEIAPLKAGIAFIALKSNTTIIPTYIHGTYEIWPVGKKIPKLWGKTAVVFGSPIHVSDLKVDDKKELQNQILERLDRSIRALKEWYEKGAEGIPP
jgi:1-acyl-sn-glycerol-3-phosphate acyltransferase